MDISLQSPFFCQKVLNFIKSEKNWKSFKVQINNHNFTFMYPNRLVEYFKKDKRILYNWWNSWAKNINNKPVNVKLIMTPIKKTFPIGNKIGVSEMNSGWFDLNKREIIIFRRQEWPKVLTHEWLHSSDFDLSNIKFKNLKGRMEEAWIEGITHRLIAKMNGTSDNELKELSLKQLKQYRSFVNVNDWNEFKNNLNTDTNALQYIYFRLGLILLDLIEFKPVPNDFYERLKKVDNYLQENWNNLNILSKELEWNPNLTHWMYPQKYHLITRD